LLKKEFSLSTIDNLIYTDRLVASQNRPWEEALRLARYLAGPFEYIAGHISRVASVASSRPWEVFRRAFASLPSRARGAAVRRYGARMRRTCTHTHARTYTHTEHSPGHIKVHMCVSYCDTSRVAERACAGSTVGCT